MKIHTYTSKGEKSADTTMPASMSSDINMYILAQAVRVYEDRVHPMRGIAKTRAEVTASTRKVYKQKGTGRARHGSISAPIFVGGGKAHGPRGLKRVLTLPVVIRRKALKVAFSLKAKENKIVFVTGLNILDKTKKTQTLLDKITTGETYKTGCKYTFLLSKENKEVQKFVRNVENVNVSSFDQANAYTVYKGGVIVVDADMFGKEEKVIKKSVKKVVAKKVVKKTK